MHVQCASRMRGLQMHLHRRVRTKQREEEHVSAQAAHLPGHAVLPGAGVGIDCAGVAIRHADCVEGGAG